MLKRNLIQKVDILQCSAKASGLNVKYCCAAKFYVGTFLVCYYNLFFKHENYVKCIYLPFDERPIIFWRIIFDIKNSLQDNMA